MSTANRIGSFRGVRLPVALALLPPLALVPLLLFSASVTQRVEQFPKDAWPVMAALAVFLVFAGACLLSCGFLLLPQLRHSRVARIAFLFAVAQIALISACVIGVATA